MMKKLGVLLLIVAMAFAMTACQNNEPKATATPEVTEAATDAPAEDATDAPAEDAAAENEAEVTDAPEKDSKN